MAMARVIVMLSASLLVMRLVSTLLRVEMGCDRFGVI